MPIKMMTIKSTKKETLGEPVEIGAYYWNDDSPLLGVVVGHFAPFTGKYGHARMIETAKKIGIDRFVVAMPMNKQPLDDDRNMFTAEQKEYIIEQGCKELGLNVIEAITSVGTFPPVVLREVMDKYPKDRVVLLCGPDRMNEYLKWGRLYKKENKSSLIIQDPNFRKFEVYPTVSRGKRNVSATTVRQYIKDNDKESFLEATGYSENLWRTIRKFLLENGVVEISENSSFMDFLEDYEILTEEVVETKRVGIKHLYAPGNSQEISALDFLDIIKWLKDQGGKLDDRINVSYSEKSDGAAFRMGLNSKNEFFIEQSYSGPVYDSDFFTKKYKEKFGFNNRLGRGWSNLLDTLKRDTKIQNILKKYNTESGIKLIGEIYINELGMDGDIPDTMKFVGTEYYKSKIGTFCTIILIEGLDGDGVKLQNFNKIKKDLIATSNKRIIFDDTNYDNKFGGVDLNDEISELEEAVKELEEEYGEALENILKLKSKKRVDLDKRRKIKRKIQEIQGKFESKIKKLFMDTEGKWGPQREGVVLKLANDVLLKITSDEFKKFKETKDDSMNKWLLEPLEDG